MPTDPYTSITSYFWSRTLNSRLDNVPFYSLIMLAMRRADTDNMAALESAFPEIAQDLRRRYNATAGLLESDPFTIEEAELIINRIQAQARAIFESES